MRARSRTATPTDGGILSPAYLATTVGMFSLIALVAFEAMAVTTVMPTVARQLDGFALYAVSFSAPLASGVVDMVAAGMWADRRGPVAPLLAALAMFSLGLLVCASAPSMGVLVAGRVVQGLGGGALTVGLYVLVGTIYPGSLQPSIFAAFAAAWVLPALFGPGLAAYAAHVLSWRWVFGGTVALVAAALALIAPALRRVSPHPEPTHTPPSRLAWALLGGAAALGLDLLGSRSGWGLPVALAALLIVGWSLTRLLPPGALYAVRGLPAVVATRGGLSAAFFCAEAYLVYVLQQRWSLSVGQAGIALTCVGVVWALASQGQARLGARLSHRRAMRVGSAVVGAGMAVVLAAVAAQAHGWPAPAWVPAAAYVVAGAGMGFAYPRTSVAMLAESTDRDRGFNSAALSVADSLGAATALSVAGVGFALATRMGGDPFVTVYAIATAVALLGALAAGRTRG